MTIKELRKEKGLTLSAFAKALGIGMSTLTAYEAGKREPNAKTLAAVKEVYGVELDAAAVETAVPAKKEKKASAKKATKATPVKKEAKAAPKAEEAKAAEKPAKKAAKAAPAPKAEEAKNPAKKSPAKKGAKAAKTGVVIIQSPMGGEITPEEILSRLGEVDRVYVKVEENAAYWVNGEESGAINLW